MRCLRCHTLCPDHVMWRFCSPQCARTYELMWARYWESPLRPEEEEGGEG